MLWLNRPTGASGSNVIKYSLLSRDNLFQIEKCIGWFQLCCTFEKFCSAVSKYKRSWVWCYSEMWHHTLGNGCPVFWGNLSVWSSSVKMYKKNPHLMTCVKKKYFISIVSGVQRVTPNSISLDRDLLSTNSSSSALFLVQRLPKWKPMKVYFFVVCDNTLSLLY